jgi:deoxycytidylate deaminase
MKHRVGAILFRENRIPSTGYGKQPSLIPPEGKDLGEIASFIVTRTLLHMPFFSLFVTRHL